MAVRLAMQSSRRLDAVDATLNAFDDSWSPGSYSSTGPTFLSPTGTFHLHRNLHRFSILRVSSYIFPLTSKSHHRENRGITPFIACIFERVSSSQKHSRQVGVPG